MKFQSVLCLWIIFGFTNCFRTRVPIGIIVEPGNEVSITIARYSLWKTEQSFDGGTPFVIEPIEEFVKDGDAVQLDRAVCRLLKSGIYALLTPTTSFSYQMLVSYSNAFQLPLISPSFPKVPPDMAANYGVTVQPTTTRAVLDVIRYYKWNYIVYLYDADDGPEKLQTIFQLGYRVLQFQLLGILRVTNAEEANLYLRKLETVKKRRSFHVVLDMDPALARDIVVRHVHDAHIGKNNFHFLLTQPVLEEFWTSQAAEFGAVNVTGFQAITTGNARSFQNQWKQLSPKIWKGAGTKDLNVSSYFLYDAGMVLSEGIQKMLRRPRNASHHVIGQQESRECLESPPTPSSWGSVLAQYMKQTTVENGMTGKIRFDNSGKRSNFILEVTETIPRGHRLIGTWSDTNGLRISNNQASNLPTALPRVDLPKRHKIISVLAAPFLMLQSSVNGSDLVGNDRFIGYSKDLIDLLAKEMDFQYELQLVEDGKYGKFDEVKGEWNGMIGELIRGKAAMAVADLTITGLRQRVVDFADPHLTISLSLMMKHPQSMLSASPTFFLSAFSKEVWTCIVVSAILVSLLFFAIAKFTGSPDNIESASGIWGKNFTIVGSVWFTLGSSLMQGTGIYPRSISSRILCGAWWCFTLILLSLYVASLTAQLYANSLGGLHSPQMARLNSLSMESIMRESVANGWPSIGLIKDGSTMSFIKQSTLPVYKNYASFIRSHPEVVFTSSKEGAQRVRQQNGQFAMLLESLSNEYISKQEPCDTIMIGDSVAHAGYGIALPLWSPLKFDLNDALDKLRHRGELGHLHRKWWTESSPCIRNKAFQNYESQEGSLYSISGIFYALLIGLCFVAVISIAQYFWKTQKKEGRRQRLSFDDVALGQTLPLPPPELLMDPPIEEDNGLIDGWAERKLVPTSFGHSSHHSRNDNEPTVH